MLHCQDQQCINVSCMKCMNSPRLINMMFQIDQTLSDLTHGYVMPDDGTELAVLSNRFFDLLTDCGRNTRVGRLLRLLLAVRPIRTATPVTKERPAGGKD